MSTMYVRAVSCVCGNTNKPDSSVRLPPPQPIKKTKAKMMPPQKKPLFYHPYRTAEEMRVEMLRNTIVDELNHVLRYCDPVIDGELSEACEARWDSMGSMLLEMGSIVKTRSATN